MVYPNFIKPDDFIDLVCETTKKQLASDKGIMHPEDVAGQLITCAEILSIALADLAFKNEEK